MKKKNIVKICQIIPNLKAGGAQIFLYYLSTEMSKNSDLTLIVLDEVDFNDNFTKSLKQKFDALNLRMIYLNRISLDYISFIKCAIKLRNVIKKEQFDIVNTHLPISHFIYSIIRANRKSHIITVHNAPENLNYINKYLNKNTSRVYCSTNAYKFNKKTNIISRVIENGVPINSVNDLKIFNKNIILEELEISIDSKIILSVGAIRKQKNYMFLVNLVKEYFEGTNCHFIICGGLADDINFKNLDEFKKYKNIHFLGQRNDVPYLTKIADVFLSCSIFEGLPIAVLEAVFNGVPCVLSPIDTHIDVFKTVKGIAIPSVFNIDHFKTEILKMIESSFNKADLIEEREDFINKYDINNTASAYLNFYRELIQSYG